MKKLFLLLLLISSQFVNAQRKVIPTEQFSISGKIKVELKFTLADLNVLETKAIPDIVITNNSGETKSTAKDLNLGLIKAGPEKIVDAIKATTPTISKCFFHLPIDL